MVTGVLFPDMAVAWGEWLKGTEALADRAFRLAKLDGVPSTGPPDPEAVSRTMELVADLVGPAKVTALEKLGEGPGRSASPPAGCGRRWPRRQSPKADPVAETEH